MKQFITLTMWLLILWLLLGGIANSETVIPPELPRPATVFVFKEGQEPQIVKTPLYSYLGTRSLEKTDRIIRVVSFTTAGSIYEKIPELHEKAYLKLKCNPKNMRMLVTVFNRNRAFTTSGNVSATWSNSENESMGNKNSTQNLYGGASLSKLGF